MKVTRDNWIMFGALLLVVLAAVAVVFVPQDRKLAQAQTAIASEQASLSVEAQQARALPALVGEVEQLKKQFSDFDKRMPARAELGEFLREISQTLTSRQLANELIHPGDPTREELYHTLPIKMKFQGNYLSLGRFIKELDDMERLTRVHKLMITSDKRSTDPDALNIELDMNIYFTES